MMKSTYLILLFLLVSTFTFSQAKEKESTLNSEKVYEAFNGLLQTIESNYSYLDKEVVNIKCIKEYYSKQIATLKNPQELVLFFENVLFEFYDNHFLLNINNKKSYRTSAPIFLKILNDKILIENVWTSQIKNLNINILGAEVLSFNNADFSVAIQNFPIHCIDKNNQKVKQWIVNKIIYGTYNQPRVLKLKLKNGNIIILDLDSLEIEKSKELLEIEIINNVGIIKINDALGNNNLITVFDEALNSLLDTKAIILDLRNTPSGGNTYVAKGIMSRFVISEKAYQKHSFYEDFSNQPKIKRSFVEYVSPRGKIYKKPLIVLSGRWTGSMGEGLTIGLDGLQRATIVGTTMKQLLGAVYTVPFKNFNFAFNMPAEKLFHIDGTPRENFIPKYYIKQTKIDEDEFLEKAFEIINCN